MPVSFWIAAVSLPFVGGLHRLAASYGYRGIEWSAAVQEAWRVGVMLTIISALIVLLVLHRQSN